MSDDTNLHQPTREPDKCTEAAGQLSPLAGDEHGEGVIRFYNAKDESTGFLSNYYFHDLIWNGQEYKSSEHAYQSIKFTGSPAIREQVVSCHLPADAFHLSRKHADDIDADWGERKLDVMEQVLRAKFADPRLKARLMETGTCYLVEASTSGDCFWGICTKSGMGENRLGKILMKIRDA
mmetsp:Transcript_39418/g.99339  ORF Transcript_39418/g.99339 Transcript_39418/m.99339 type:complete len:179 (+) Transcript_39418:212-748(+)|eukprot:CAMPEP_0177630176 /NCGR_PEP_ID=MMETSP0447-20121125/1072_1 /TAXON_ID=0 /ORGANISM="Stygamoeba regulata, Strain BSH-02190019" /LENGTH=178 /DNA_ID=CAMNT_0019131567 /DNA_START=267 /DNA_END=803 /DNA_ORIENTATION=+